MPLKVLSRNSILSRVNHLNSEASNQIKELLKSVDYVCTTADIWSTKQRRFLGVTCHWLDPDTLIRKSTALACRRFQGTHSYDRVSLLLDEIHGEYGIDNKKIVATLTDNTSNFLKAFRKFGINVNIDIMLTGLENSPAEDVDTDSYEDVNHVLEDDLGLSVNENIEESQPELFLPCHHRCTSHTLNLIPTSDMAKYIKSNTALRSRNTTIMQKCSILWKMAGRPKSAEIIKETLGCQLRYPGITRWNSLNDSLTQILKNKTKLSTFYEALNVKAGDFLKETDIAYIEEYCEILQPLAQALDILQGDLNPYGYVLPTILSLNKKLCNLREKNV